MRNLRKILAALAAVLLFTAACSGSNNAASQLGDDQSAAAVQLDRYQKTQPVPSFDWSQLRENALEIMKFQVEGAQSTTFFFNLGIADPVMSCPSIGDPIPTTVQLTNPDQRISGHKGAVSLPLIEQSGVYTGDSTGTNVICIDAQGQGYKVLWEGFVMSVSTPAVWSDGQITLTGPSAFDFSESQ